MRRFSKAGRSSRTTRTGRTRIAGRTRGTGGTGGTGRVGNIAIASVTAVALCTGAWLLLSGAETQAPPQPSAAQAAFPDTGDQGRQRPRCTTPRPSAYASPRSA